jgi:hypothetical protein
MTLVSKLLRTFLCCVWLVSMPAFAWGPDGHHAVGAIADQLIVNSHAADQVKALLGGLSLRDAAVWADCVKGIDPAKDFTYQSTGKFPECKIYETADSEALMSDFVRRNDSNCDRKPTEESCHKQYHYADIAIQHDHYDPAFHGARNDDIVAALTAAIQVLKGELAPAPFAFKDKREALLVLTHYIGDIHQPLHVGAVYLDARGKRVNPEKERFDAATETRGGNDILLANTSKVNSKNLHSAWDAYPISLGTNSANELLLKRARSVQATSGELTNWPVVWANEAVISAQQAFKGLRFGKKQSSNWTVSLSGKYLVKMDRIKQEQLAKAGKRLADLLQAIWP